MTIQTTHDDTKDKKDDYFIPAVLFLSMASAAGMERDTNGEPIRIQIQREAGHRRAIELKAGIVKEFFEIGSARDWRKRPAIQAMMTYIQKHPEVTYVVFPESHRFSRSVQDAVELRQRFEELGVEVVIGQGPIGSVSADVDEVMKALTRTMTELDTRERSRRARVQRIAAAHDQPEIVNQ